jgi:ubiquinone/menaquinone biosynthesis C-methylase UbiE
MSETNLQPERPVLKELDEGRIDILPPNIVEGMSDRMATLGEFASDPSNPDIWSRVANNVRQEESEGTAQPEELSDISPESLIGLAHAVLQADPKDRYSLVAQKAPNGSVWFDVLYGFHSPSGDKAIEEGIKWQIGKLKTNEVDQIVDLGTGTGKTAAVAAKYARNTTGVDRNMPLLEVAKDSHPDIHFVDADVTKLPFGDGSVDIITSDGLKYALDLKASIQMYSEIARVLKTGGVYIDTDWVDPSYVGADFHPEELKEFVTWRAVLQDMIVDTVSGKFEKADALNMYFDNDWTYLKTQIGLYEEGLSSSVSRTKAKARMLYKVPAKAESSYRSHQSYLRNINSN